MKKRDLKKSIRYTCGEIASEAAFTGAVMNGGDLDLMAQVIIDAARLQAKSLEKVSVSFDRLPKDFADKAEYRKARHAYYKKAYAALVEEFNKQLAEIVKKMNSALPKVEE